MSCTTVQTVTQPAPTVLILPLRSMTREAEAQLKRIMAILERHVGGQDPRSPQLINCGIQLLERVQKGDLQGVVEIIHQMRHHMRASPLDGEPMSDVAWQGDTVEERWKLAHLIQLGLRPDLPLETHQLATELAEWEGEVLSSNDLSLRRIAEEVRAHDRPEGWLDRDEMEQMDPVLARIVYTSLLSSRGSQARAESASERLGVLEREARISLEESAARVSATTGRIITGLREGDAIIHARLAHLEATQAETTEFMAEEIRHAHTQVRELTAQGIEQRTRIYELSSSLNAAIQRIHACEQNIAQLQGQAASGGGDSCTVM